MNRIGLWKVFGGWSALLLLASVGSAQTTFATITGTVTDASGALVPNVTVTATNVLTGVKSSAKSNEAGIYTIPQLKEGVYSVEAEAAGFKKFAVHDISLVSRDVRRVDIQLEVGTVETTVEVRGGATLIETETARIGNTKTSMVLNTLPLNTRGLWAYLALTPNVQQQPGSSVVRFGGSRVNQGNWSLDGVSFSDGVDNTQTGPFANYIESFQEVKIDLANNSAEFGAMGQVTIVSKSGTNDLHGTIFDYYSTPWFRARDYFAVARPTGVFHAPGGAAGGPVLLPKIYDGRNKTFFYYSFETSRGSQRTQNLRATVPTVAWREGDFSDRSEVLRNPFSGEIFPGKRIPASLINPVARKIQDRFYPLPNYGNTAVFANLNYREAKTRPYDPSTYWTTRGDHRLSDKGYVFGRFTWHRLYNRPYESNLPTLGQRNQVRSNRAATVSHTQTISPTMVNEIRWGFHFNNNPIRLAINGPQLVKELGLVGLAPGIPEDFTGVLRINWSGVAPSPISPSVNHRPVGYRTHTEEVQEHFSWFRNRHNLKFGVNMLRAEYDSYGAPANLFGNLTFTNRFTGFPYADFLMGIPTRAARAFPAPRVDRNRWSLDFYALDDFKVSSRLTLNLGLRYEAHFPWRDNRNLLSVFDINSGKIVIPDGGAKQISPIFPRNYVDIVEASQIGLRGRSIVRMDRNNLAPRVGIAYRPWGPRTVFRAGWGVFYDVVPFIYGLTMGGVPFVVNEPSYTNPTANPGVILPRVFPESGVGGPSSVSIPSALNPNFRTPYSMQYNFTIERQQWETGFRVSYVGTGGRKSAYAWDYNAPVPDARPYIEKPRRFPNYPSIFYITNGAGHQYNAMTVEVNRQMVRGLYLQSSWTWARDIYDMDYNWDFDNWQFTLENPLDRKRERAVSGDIPTHRWNTNWIYQLPIGRGKHWFSGVSRLTNLFVGGWEISGIFSAQTGQFLTPFWTGPDPVGIFYTDSDPAEVSLRPDILRNPNLAKNARSIARWFDTQAYAPPPLGRFGTSAKGTVKGPGVNVWHMGLHKEFLFRENKARLRWEMTATNIFNHPNWSNPGTDMSDPTTFGIIDSVGGVNGDSTGDVPGVRSFRMGVRFTW